MLATFGLHHRARVSVSDERLRHDTRGVAGDELPHKALEAALAVFGRTYFCVDRATGQLAPVGFDALYRRADRPQAEEKRKSLEPLAGIVE
jgi:hypothetical protein